MTIESQIESILFFKNEPVSIKELSKILALETDIVKQALSRLERSYEGRGITLVTDGDSVSLGTNPEVSELIEKIQKEEFSRELGRAGLETLVIVLYRGPVSRREIDYIRGVNSGFTLRALLVRGLIERTEGEGRGHVYKPTLKLLEHLGIKKIEELPEFQTAFKKIEEFLKTESEKTDEENG